MKIAEIKKQVDKYYIVIDPYVIDVIFATVIGNQIIRRDPLWTMLVASSSGGKSSLMAPLDGGPSMHFVDDVTEKTFLSGYNAAKDKTGKKTEASLLKKIGNGMMVMSDFTAMLSKNPQSKADILSQFRLIYDGKFIRNTGLGELKWQGKIGFLGASTPDIYFQLEQSRSMGERFLYYSIIQPTDEQVVIMQEKVEKSYKDITADLASYYAGYLQKVNDYALTNGIPILNVTPEQRRRIHDAAIFCVLGKTSVHTDFRSGVPDSMPNKPGVGRDRKMFDTMLHALQLMNAYEKGDWGLPVQDWHVSVIERCAYSSINRERRKILEILSCTDGPLKGSEIGAMQGLGLQKEAVEKYLAPLMAIGIITKVTDGSAFKWKIDNEVTKTFIRRVAGIEKEKPIVTPLFEDELDKQFHDF